MNLTHHSLLRQTFRLFDSVAIRTHPHIRYLAIVTLVLCLLPNILQMMGIDFGIAPPSFDKSILKQQDLIEITNTLHGLLSGSFVHTILEWSAFCTGVLTAILAFVHFALNRDIATPIMGLSLFYAGCMDAFHTLAADRLISGVAPPETLIPFTWAICRLFSALILIMGGSLFLIPKRLYPQHKLRFLALTSAFAAVFAYATIYICVQLRTLPQTMFPTSPITRPWDVAPLILFVFVGLFIFPRFYQHCPNLFAQSLIISTIPQVAAQLHMSFGSSQLFDSDFNIAHFLKILAYLIPFIGLCLMYIQIHQEKENTVHKLIEAENVIQSEKMSSLGHLVAGVAHEINNPVNFIYGNLAHAENYIDEIQEIVNLYQHHYPKPPPTIQQKIDEIELDFLLEDFSHLARSMRVGTERIQNIVLALRNFSRLDEAEVKLADIHEGIDSTLLILASQLKSKPERSEIEIVQKYGDIPFIECYPNKLNQVFMNILSNAIDALAEKCTQQPNFQPQICIFTQFDRDRCTIQIQDNGSGIPEKIRSRIFDPFFTTKPVGQGTGLGLSISYQIITETHKGQLICHSNSDSGTEFKIIIPQSLSHPPKNYSQKNREYLLSRTSKS
ncbi:MAG: histidine kinase [Cyanobacteria bacterium SBLK]|nr:histidine kinase [Cyanobacteria bacterium SBLK]